MTKTCSRLVLLLGLMFATAHAVASVTVDDLLARDNLEHDPARLGVARAEQFALMTGEAEARPDVHAGVQELVAEQNVPVHVCETHASWRDVNPEDFPDYVDVTPAGPVQIRMYQELGYELVVISGY